MDRHLLVWSFHICVDAFAGDFVITADYTVLENAPKAFNRIGVHRTDHILSRRMPASLVIEVGQTNFREQVS